VTAAPSTLLAPNVRPELLLSIRSAWTRLSNRIQRDGLLSHLFGLLIRWKFQRAGILVVHGGFPLPSVENRGGRIELGNCGLFSGVRFECWSGALLQVGTGTYLNRNTEIVATRSVVIGRDCKIARDVIIMDSDQHAVPGEPEPVSRPVNIGDRVWIGARAIVLKGVTIGSDSVIGAGAVVTRNVPPASVVVGPSARALRSMHVGTPTPTAHRGRPTLS
jgi:acetyltransferase-like isoleucine patch superfamily enzyme